jgi:hypothetical protein
MAAMSLFRVSAQSSGAHIDLNDANPPASGDGWTFSGNTYTLLDGANATMSGSNENGNLHIAITGNVTLLLQNVTLNTASGAIAIGNGSKLNLILEGENRMETGTPGTPTIFIDNGTLRLRKKHADKPGALLLYSNNTSADISGTGDTFIIDGVATVIGSYNGSNNGNYAPTNPAGDLISLPLYDAILSFEGEYDGDLASGFDIYARNPYVAEGSQLKITAAYQGVPDPQPSIGITLEGRDVDQHFEVHEDAIRPQPDLKEGTYTATVVVDGNLRFPLRLHVIQPTLVCTLNNEPAPSGAAPAGGTLPIWHGATLVFQESGNYILSMREGSSGATKENFSTNSGLNNVHILLKDVNIDATWSDKYRPALYVDPWSYSLNITAEGATTLKGGLNSPGIETRNSLFFTANDPVTILGNGTGAGVYIPQPSYGMNTFSMTGFVNIRGGAEGKGIDAPTSSTGAVHIINGMINISSGKDNLPAIDALHVGISGGNVKLSNHLSTYTNSKVLDIAFGSPFYYEGIPRAYLNILTIPNAPNTPITKANITWVRGDSYYDNAHFLPTGIQTDDQGKLYLYLPETEHADLDAIWITSGNNQNYVATYKREAAHAEAAGTTGSDNIQTMEQPGLVITSTQQDVNDPANVKRDGPFLCVHSGSYTISMREDRNNPDLPVREYIKLYGDCEITLKNVHTKVNSRTPSINIRGTDEENYYGFDPAFTFADPGTVLLKLEGENILDNGSSSGINVPEGAALTIEEAASNASLTVNASGKMVTAIGGGDGYGSDSYGSITINSGRVTANGSRMGAGIGGMPVEGSAITINGGYVKAVSQGGAGIGGIYAMPANITITGGDVEAISQLYTADDGIVFAGAGIGTGGGMPLDYNDGHGNGSYIDIFADWGLAHKEGETYYLHAGSINITGGRVTAIGAGDGSQPLAGAGIGTGSYFAGTGTDILVSGEINISGGTVTAIAGQSSEPETVAAIGGGYANLAATNITITGGSVHRSNELGSQPTDGINHPVYLNVLTGYTPNAPFASGRIAQQDYADTADPSKGVYGIHDVYADASGQVYFYFKEPEKEKPNAPSEPEESEGSEESDDSDDSNDPSESDEPKNPDTATLSLTITPANNQSKVYGDDDPAGLIYTASGWQNNDDNRLLTGSLGREPGENAGQYNILQNNLSETSGRYSLHLVPKVKFTIAPSPQTIEFTPPDTLFTDGNSAYTLVATATTPGKAPELPVRFRLAPGDDNKATLEGAVLTPKAPGTITVTAYVEPNGNYEDAIEVSREITLIKLEVIVNVDNATETSDKLYVVNDPASQTSIVTIAPPGNNTRIRYNGIEQSGNEAFVIPVNMSRAGTQTVTFLVILPNGEHMKSYTLKIEQHLAFQSYVAVKWNTLFILHYRKLTEEAYNPSSCRWYRNNEPIGEKLFYSNDEKPFTAGDTYRFEIETLEGIIRSTDYVVPSAAPTSASATLSVYPNPIEAGQPFYLSLNDDSGSQATGSDMIYVYDSRGTLLLQQRASYGPTPLRLEKAGVYIIRMNRLATKVIVK